MQTIASDASASSDLETILVDLALQGGGSHGAFTWGVLCRLLEETWLRIDGTVRRLALVHPQKSGPT